MRSVAQFRMGTCGIRKMSGSFRNRGVADDMMVVCLWMNCALVINIMI
jgi:hypothetical protein